MIFSTDGLELFFNKTTFGVERLSIAGDAECLSWVRGREFALPSGNNFLLNGDCRDGKLQGEFLFFSGLTCTMTVSFEDDAAVFHYLFKNGTKKEIVTEKGDLGIYLPFNDDFDDPLISLRRRVHAHVRAQGQAYVYCERYSGDLPSLGLVVTKGESDSYSLERGAGKSSRGKIILDLPALRLAAGESYEFEWKLFPCRGRKDFFDKAASCGLLTASTSESVVFAGEEIVVTSENALMLRTEDGDLPFKEGRCRFVANGWGAHHATILGENGRSITMSYFVLSRDLPQKRIDYLLEKQYVAEGPYAGAFTAYDPQSMRQIVQGGIRSPFNLGGMRATPFFLLLRAGEKGVVSAEKRAKIDASVAFYDREIYMGNGEVADDVGRNRARFGKKYYNYPLFAAIKYEEYRYLGSVACLKESAAILDKMYRRGVLYEVSPVLTVEAALRKEGETVLSEKLRDAVIDAADRLIRSGNKYAPFKGLPYGPEIVYGSLATLLDAYLMTKNDYYLHTAQEHFARLETFSFPSLDYSTDEVPEIFERDRASGLIYDMSPHYTVAYFALVYDKYYRATGEERARYLSRRALKSALTLFGENGAGSRSKAAPRSVNDIRLGEYEQISYGEDVVLYFFDLLFDQE